MAYHTTRGRPPAAGRRWRWSRRGPCCDSQGSWTQACPRAPGSGSSGLRPSGPGVVPEVVTTGWLLFWKAPSAEAPLPCGLGDPSSPSPVGSCPWWLPRRRGWECRAQAGKANLSGKLRREARPVSRRTRPGPLSPGQQGRAAHGRHREGIEQGLGSGADTPRSVLSRGLARDPLARMQLAHGQPGLESGSPGFPAAPSHARPCRRGRPEASCCAGPSPKGRGSRES